MTTPTRKIDFAKYQQFVDAVTSDESKDFIALSDRLVALDTKGANIERLLTGTVGICAEGGEALDVVKKLIFQGKGWNDEARTHLKRELGDVLWYVAQCLIALDITFEEVIDTNIEKLQKRYPGGTFDSYYAEHREDGDL